MNIAGIDIGYVATVIGVILVSMTFHEAMHGFVAYWLGDDTAKLQGRLTLNPLKHIDPFLTILLPVLLAVSGAPIFGGAKPVPFNPDRVRYDEWGAALVALAGPLTNLVLAFISCGILAIMVGYAAPGPIIQLMAVATYVNLGFFVFNMIPFPPLDGSRVLYALAPEFVRRGMEAIERFGIIIVLLLVLTMSQQIGAFMLTAILFIFKLFLAIFGLQPDILGV